MEKILAFFIPSFFSPSLFSPSLLFLAFLGEGGLLISLP